METLAALPKFSRSSNGNLGRVAPSLRSTGPLNRSFLKEEAGLRRTPYRLAFKSKFATPMSLYTNYPSEALGGWVEEEED